MRRLIQFAFLFLLALPLHAQILAYDNFTRGSYPQNPMTGSGWTVVDLKVQSAGIVEATTTGVSGTALYTGITWPNDQYSTITFGSNGVPSNTYPALYVRSDIAFNNAYQLVFNGDSNVVYFQKYVSGTPSQLGANLSATPSAGDVWALGVVGSTLTAYQNGVSVGTRTDTDIISGTPGFGIFFYGVATSSTTTVTSWRGGALVNGEEAAVDFNVTVGTATQRASGFLHGMNSTVPADNVVLPLKPKWFRSSPAFSTITNDPAVYARIVGMGATPEYILGQAWLFNIGGFNPTNATLVTSATMSQWVAMVTSIVTTAISNGQSIQWDIWNEPDTSIEWTGTEAQFEAAWAAAVNTIRGISGTQTIVGPSTSLFVSAITEDILVYGAANNVLPNVWSFHEIGYTPQVSAGHLASAQAYLAANDPGITEIQINEYTPPSPTTSTYYPGANVQFLAAFERAQIYSAGRSCWNSDCTDPDLDGLLQVDGATTNAGWYAYKAYADITGHIVSVIPSTPVSGGIGVDGVAGADSTAKRAYSVFGRNGGFTDDVYLSFLNVPSYLISGGTVNANVYAVANDNGAGSTGPILLSSTPLTVNGSGGVTVHVTNAQATDQSAIIVQLSVAPSGSNALWFGLP